MQGCGHCQSQTPAAMPPSIIIPPTTEPASAQPGATGLECVVTLLCWSQAGVAWGGRHGRGDALEGATTSVPLPFPPESPAED